MQGGNIRLQVVDVCLQVFESRICIAEVSLAQGKVDEATWHDGGYDAGLGRDAVFFNIFFQLVTAHVDQVLVLGKGVVKCLLRDSRFGRDQAITLFHHIQIEQAFMLGGIRSCTNGQEQAQQKYVK